MLSCNVRAWVGAAAATLCAGRAPAEPADFARDVRPLLASRCFECHGEKRVKSGLRLDVRTSALRGGDSGAPAIVPRKAAESALIRRVTSADPKERMPPKGDPLAAAQIAILRTWIDEGAAWPDDLAGGPAKRLDHWAFRAPVKPKPPETRDASWPRNPVDRFILARLEKEGLAPAPESDKITLIRRLHLDLVGLPPTIEEVDAFLADSSPGAYEREAEKLLASPHHGERWGRHWLDAARYADSDGFEKDMSRQVWAYRDYVIGAFNRDLPYDRFIVEQLAGDLLPSPDQDQIVATGFLRNSMLNEEGGIDPEQFRMEAMFDRMDALGKAVLGLTIQCAQCHDHKYDPLTQEEYYRLFAFLNNDHEGQPVIYTPAERMKIAKLRRAMAGVEDDIRHRMPDWEERMAAWEESVRGGQPEWTVVESEFDGENDQRYIYLEDGSILAQGYKPTIFSQEFKAKKPVTAPVAAFRLEYFRDPNLPCGGPGRSFMGTCALTEFAVEAASAAEPGKKTKVKIVKATADYSNETRDLEPNFDDLSGKKRVTGPVDYAIDGKEDTAWGIDAGPGRRNQDRKAVFVAESPASFPGGTLLTFQLSQKHGGWNSDDHMNNNLGRFRLSVTSARDASADPLPRRVREIVSAPREKRTPGQTAEVFGYWRTLVPELRAANDRIEELWKQWPAGSTSLVLIARDEARDTRILKRGDWLKPAEKVSAGTPRWLHPFPEGAPATRLTFARWLTDPRSPTTARVIVNRIWQEYFGTGLVDTPEDFGLRSSPPSHPELLDWLACELVERGWSLKAIHRLILGSATYRQVSRLTPELAEKDPLNRLLARGPRLRIEGEIVRDVALAASGLLDERIGGKSVMPPAPAYLFKPPASYAPFPWIDATGPDRYRRGLYTFRRRSTPFPALQVFDVPNADFSCVRRQRSNTPLQALTTLNEGLFMECAQALALLALRDGGPTDAERVAFAFRRCVARRPDAAEVADLLGLLARQEKRFREGWASPREVAFADPAHPPELPAGETPTRLGAWTMVARVILNLDETITKE